MIVILGCALQWHRPGGDRSKHGSLPSAAASAGLKVVWQWHQETGLSCEVVLRAVNDPKCLWSTMSFYEKKDWMHHWQNVFYFILFSFKHIQLGSLKCKLFYQKKNEMTVCVLVMEPPTQSLTLALLLEKGYRCIPKYSNLYYMCRWNVHSLQLLLKKGCWTGLLA